MLLNAYSCIEIYIPNVYFDVTQCITPNVYTRQYTLGIYIVLHFLTTSYTLGDSIYIGIHWDNNNKYLFILKNRI